MKKITEKEWNDKGINLLEQYSFAEILNYFAKVEVPKIIEDYDSWKKDHFDKYLEEQKSKMDKND